MSSVMCETNGHEFSVLKRDYYKRLGDMKNQYGLPQFDQSQSFSMLYCSKCGDTKEVLSAKHI